MLYLRTLGGLALENGGRPLTGAGAQRSRLALLAVLAAAGNRGATRDRLLALFWPESDTDAARGALKQAHYALRRDLGEQDVISGSADLRLNPAVIGSDIGDFRLALAAGENERAVSLYLGPFLDGVHFGGDELDRWVEAERGRLAEDYRSTLQKLGRAAEAVGDHAVAVHWWRTLSSADPLSASAARCLMHALVASGDSAAALRHARDYEQLVRAELDAAPDASVVELTARIRNGTAIAKTPESAAEGPPPPSEWRSARGGAQTPRRPIRRAWPAIGAVSVLTGLALVVLARQESRRDPDLVFLTGSDSLTLAELASGLVSRDSTLRISFVESQAKVARYRIAATSSAIAGTVHLAALVTDLATESSLRRIDPVVAARGHGGTAALADRIAITLASQRDPLLSGWSHAAALPATWESFEAMRRGLRAFSEATNDESKVLGPLGSAGSLDSTSAMPVVLQAFFSSPYHGSPISASIAAALDSSPRRSGRWERALLGFLDARNRNDLAGAHSAGHQLLESVPNSEWSLPVAADVLALGRAKEAVEILSRMDPDRGWARGWSYYWITLDVAYHSLGDYRAELEAAQRALIREPDSRLYMQFEVKALAGLGLVAEVEARCDRAMSLQPQAGEWWDRQPCDQAIAELQAHGHRDAARLLAERFLATRLKTIKQTPKEQAGERAFMHEQLGDWPGLGLALESWPRSDSDDRNYLWGLLLVQASRGDRSGLAETQRRYAVRRREEKGGLHSDVEQAQLAALLGDRAEATALLAKALRDGWRGRAIIHSTFPPFERLRGYAPYEALITPVEDHEHLARVFGLAKLAQRAPKAHVDSPKAP